MREYHIYILASWTRVLYVGVTSNIRMRIAEHRAGKVRGFSAQYRVTRLVYAESTPHVLVALAREKQIKGWARHKKLALIESLNPEWLDLASEWFDGSGTG
jgi:putative endonuclease